MRVITTASAFCIILIQSAAWALIDPSALGGVKAVCPSGFTDVGRNPALIPFNRETFSIGAAGSYTTSAEISGRASTKANQPSSFALTDDENKPMILSQDAGFIVRTEHAGFGFSSATNGGSTYERRKKEKELSGTIITYDAVPSAHTMIITQDIEEKSRSLNPGGSFSWGYRTSDNFSWGLGLQGGYKKTTRDIFTAGWGTTDGTAFSDSLKEKYESAEYSGNISLGFLYRQGNVEAGLLLSTSDLTMGSTDYSYTADMTTTTLSGTLTSGKTTIKQSPSMGPPSVILGFRLMSSYFDLVGEAGTLSSMSKTVDKASYDWDSSAIKKTTTEYQTGINAVCRGGIIFHPGSVLRLVLGGGYSVMSEKQYEKSKGSYSSSDTEIFTQTLLGSGGIELNLGSHLTLGVTGIYAHALAKGSSNNNQTKISIRSTADIVQTSAGIALSF